MAHFKLVGTSSNFQMISEQLHPLVSSHLRESPRIQFAPAEALLIGRAVRAFPECRFLVFGAGNDSAMWRRINSNGVTVFLEHNPDWIRKVTQGDASLDIRQVEYSTRITQWRAWLDAAEPARLKIPTGVDDNAWNVVLIDAPNGFAMVDDYPGYGPVHGRMQSIEAARRLVAAGGFIFVHDAERVVEAACSNQLLGPGGRLLFQFRMTKNNGRKTEMRCYFFPAPADGVPWRARRLQFLSWWLGVRQIPDTQKRFRATNA